MNNLNDSLPDLMRRATENLEPESPDLVERGMRRGTALRRRRNALLSFTGAAAAVATAGIIVGGTQMFAGNSPSQAPLAGASTPSAKASSAKPSVASPAQTLDTLTKLLPGNLKLSAPKSRDDNGSYHAEVVVDDGKGASLITARLTTTEPNRSCAGLHGQCTVRPDGSVVRSVANELILPNVAESNPGGVKNSLVEIFYPDGRLISLYNFNAAKPTAARHTRPEALFSPKDLSRIASSDQWVYPGERVASSQPDPQSPGAGKPTVPLTATLQTLKSVLPDGLQLTRPETWGGGQEGHNGASYVVNDGKGASRVDVLVMYTAPVTKCSGEGLQKCEVRADGAVLSWSKNEPTYSDERQAVNGVLANRIEIRYPDGRAINMTSYNGPQEKGAPHTRAKPMFSTDELLTMAGDPAWKFPGTGPR